MSHYETLISDEYWAGGIEPPTVGYIHDKLDAMSAMGFAVKNRIEGDYYHLKTAATRKLMVEEGEELPMPDAELKGYVQAVVDERFHGIVEPSHPVELTDTVDNFDYFADRLLARDHIGFAALMHVRGDEGDATIRRSVLFARPGLSGRQLVAISSLSINNVSRDRDWRKQTVSEPRLVLPRYLVGQVYSDTTKDGTKRDLRVRYAEHITQIPEVSDDGRPQGGKKTATLSWLKHQASLAGGQA